MNSSKVLLGILGGVAVGAIAGVLLAPASGKKTRKRIMNKTKDYAGDLKEQLNDLKDNVSHKFNGYLEDAKEVIDRNEKLIAKIEK
jgi:gas vesicle protein